MYHRILTVCFTLSAAFLFAGLALVGSTTFFAFRQHGANDTLGGLGVGFVVLGVAGTIASIIFWITIAYSTADNRAFKAMTKAEERLRADVLPYLNDEHIQQSLQQGETLSMVQHDVHRIDARASLLNTLNDMNNARSRW